MNKKIVSILDYSNNRVHIEEIDLDDFESSDDESIIDEMGYKPSDVEWMISDVSSLNIEIQNNKFKADFKL